MDTIAFIFARGGSKGLPGKNIRPFAGKPLIAWAIEQAKEVSQIRRVIVSTDSEEISDVALRYGAEVPFMRPAHLAADETPEWLAWRHALQFIQNEEGSLPDIMVSVPVTSPLRQTTDIEKCLEIFEEGDTDMVIVVTDAHRNPYFNMVKQNSDGTVGLVIPPNENVVRRQDAPEIFDMTTVAYIAAPEYIMNQNSMFSGRLKALHIPINRAIDIDSQLDFEIAEFLYKKQKSKK